MAPQNIYGENSCVISSSKRAGFSEESSSLHFGAISCDEKYIKQNEKIFTAAGLVLKLSFRGAHVGKKKGTEALKIYSDRLCESGSN